LTGDLSVSIITPSFNQGPFIERAIRSVFDQGVENLEYVVFDGGSTDETLDILTAYGDRLRWTSGPDGGQAEAVNRGLLATSGDVIGWLNSDDIYYPGAIEAACARFRADPELDVVYGDANHIDIDDSVIEAYYTEPWNLKRLGDVCFLCQPAVFFRRRMVNRFGLLDATLRYCMDYEYWVRLGLGGARFEYIRTQLAGSRLYAENKTMSSRLEVHREIADMLKRHLGRVPDRWLFNYAHMVLDNRGVTRADTWVFTRTVVWEFIRASFRWNHRVSVRGLQTSAQWLLAAIPGAQLRAHPS
jgi:glycosyltransferase involved in cell wall biosynthesis